MGRPRKVKPSAPSPAPLPLRKPPPMERTASMSDLRSIYDATVSKLKELVKEYRGSEEFPEHVVSRLQAIMGSPNIQYATEASGRAERTMLIHLLAEWGKGRIPGKITEANAAARAKKAENLAEYLDSLGQTEAAEAQRARANAILQELEATRRSNE